jgi:hypothetical protein
LIKIFVSWSAEMKNITVNAQAGRQLPADWKAQAPAKAKAAEAAYLDRVENAWRSPLNGSREGLTSRDARLTTDAAHHRSDSGHHAAVRMDGAMELIDSRADGWEQWRNAATGATVWRRKIQR